MGSDRAATTLSARAIIDVPGVLAVRPGNFVIIRAQQQIDKPVNDDWWMGQILWCEPEVRAPRVNALLQVANVDDGALHWVKAETVAHVVHALDGIGDKQ
ncbi:DUF3104 domain-containing protein [Synechococcus sp. MIT S9508]|uniref:DUF3104 domain-containing protein n=1 Tax=Synechococcus sp. MIT S9508 TaxID=1801629 RepID=UPI0007BB81B5|nr:DUF3104 domain-containing protein [Synechococcus sp. MIT S9508]KZR89717.1 hypothetical protein MITS9508_01324 [Synechococcus sp. MIT S9508]